MGDGRQPVSRERLAERSRRCLSYAALLLLLTIGPAGCGNHEPEASTAEDPPRPQLIEGPDPQAVSPDRNTTPSPVQSQAWFTEITNTAGLAMAHHAGIEGEFHVEEIMGPGCALFDFDGDGRVFSRGSLRAHTRFRTTRRIHPAGLIGRTAGLSAPYGPSGPTLA